jgi:hypothetical protein
MASLLLRPDILPREVRPKNLYLNPNKMAIDFAKLLERSDVRRWAEENYPDDYPTLVSEEGEEYANSCLQDWLHDNLEDGFDQVFCLAWDGNFPGNSGALYVQEWRGLYFITSSDYDPSGPYQSLEEALEQDYFMVETANPEISGGLPIEQLISIARGVCGEDDNIRINDVLYGWKDGELVALK